MWPQGTLQMHMPCFKVHLMHYLGLSVTHILYSTSTTLSQRRAMTIIEVFALGCVVYMHTMSVWFVPRACEQALDWHHTNIETMRTWYGQVWVHPKV